MDRCTHLADDLQTRDSVIQRDACKKGWYNIYNSELINERPSIKKQQAKASREIKNAWPGKGGSENWAYGWLPSERKIGSCVARISSAKHVINQPTVGDAVKPLTGSVGACLFRPSWHVSSPAPHGLARIFYGIPKRQEASQAVFSKIALNNLLPGVQLFCILNGARFWWPFSMFFGCLFTPC